MKIPRISVCIPTYNYGKYIGEAINSVLSQTFTDYELLIVDDCSVDKTDDIVNEFARRDARIRYIRNISNRGMVANWNYCLEEARGEYIKFLFGDDLLCSPDALGAFVAILDADTSVALAGSARKIIDQDSRFREIWAYGSDSVVVDGCRAISRCMLEKQNFIGEPSAVMFRKSQAKRGFDHRYRQIVDLEMWFHLLEQGRYAYLNEPLCAFRLHSDQQSARNAESDATLDDTFYLLQGYLDKPYLTFNRLQTRYLYYDYMYQVWKSYRKKKVLTREQALSRISVYGKGRFFALLPLYKVSKPFFRLWTKAQRIGCNN